MEKVKPNILYNMDFRDGFNSFDLSDVKLFVTDPPYNIGFQKEKSNHPCPVPMELMERIILLCTNEGDLICDPFMGKGTTALAALRTGRKYIGFELSENYWRTSLLEVDKWKNNQKKA